MVAPRAHVFRPLVKGNEALGTRLVPRVFVPYCAWLDKTNDVSDRWSMGTKTLGTRMGEGISWVPEVFLARFPVSVCLYCDPREKPLEQSAISLRAPSQ